MHARQYLLTIYTCLGFVQISGPCIRYNTIYSSILGSMLISIGPSNMHECILCRILGHVIQLYWQYKCKKIASYTFTLEIPKHTLRFSI